jgi:head-tail adaptor
MSMAESAREVSGRLAEAVVIERWQPARDAAGDDVGTWIKLARAHAELRVEGPLAPMVGGEAARTQRRWRVLLRDRDDLGLDVRLRWRGACLAVLAVARDPALPGLASLLCEGRAP